MSILRQNVNLGTFAYGDNPLFTITFRQNGVNANPGSAAVKMTDPNKAPIAPTLTPIADGQYTFQQSLTVPGIWTGRAYAPPGAGQASVDFMFLVEETRNP